MLGCRAVIPCQWNRSDSTSLKWLYKKDEYSKKIDLFVKGKKGVPRYHELFRTRMTVLSNGSLHIHHLTDEDQGIYWCEICFQDDCSDKQIKTILSKGQSNFNCLCCSHKNWSTHTLCIFSSIICKSPSSNKQYLFFQQFWKKLIQQSTLLRAAILLIPPVKVNWRS